MKDNNIQHPETKSLGTTFSILLCIYFCYLFRIIIGSVSQLTDQIIPEIKLSPTPVLYIVYYTTYYLWILYGVLAIILSLKGSNQAIRSLKLCAPIHFIGILLSALPKISYFSFSSLWLPILFVFYPLIFLLYICRSKTINEIFPKEKRHWGISGAIGIILYAVTIIILGYIAVSGALSASMSKKVDLSRLELREGELSDGRVIFTPKDNWILDSTSVLNKSMDAFYFHDVSGSSQISVVCSREEYEPSRHFYIYSIYENQPLGAEFYDGEVDYFQHEDDNTIIYVDQYRYRKDSTYYFWTYASAIGKKNSKSIRLSILDRDTLGISIEEVVSYLDAAILDIRPRLFKKDRVHKKKYSSTTNQINQPSETTLKQNEDKPI